VVLKEDLRPEDDVSRSTWRTTSPRVSPSRTS